MTKIYLSKCLKIFRFNLKNLVLQLRIVHALVKNVKVSIEKVECDAAKSFAIKASHIPMND